MSCLGVILTLAASVLHQLLRIDRAERSRGVVASSLERLAHDLRLDAHAATSDRFERSDAKLVLSLSDGRSAEYLVRETDILRTVRQSGKANLFETYRCPPGTSARFESTQVGAIVLLDLKIEMIEGKNADPTYRDYRIEAEPGRFVRLGREMTR